jgi:hypothetical protein
MDDHKDMKGYWKVQKREHYIARTHFGRGSGPSIRQDYGMKEQNLSSLHANQASTLFNPN